MVETWLSTLTHTTNSFCRTAYSKSYLRSSSFAIRWWYSLQMACKPAVTQGDTRRCEEGEKDIGREKMKKKRILMPQKSKNGSFNVLMHDTQMMETQENDSTIKSSVHGGLYHLLTFERFFLVFVFVYLFFTLWYNVWACNLVFE